jgi:serine protease Do
MHHLPNTSAKPAIREARHSLSRGRWRRSAIVVALVMGVAAPSFAQMPGAAIETQPAQILSPVPHRGAPESFADLVERVMPAVVNISAATTTQTSGRMLPQLPPGTPFEDLFEEFFNRRGQGGEAPRQQRRSNSLGSGFVVDPSGIVITNNHVIGEADDIEVIWADGRTLKAQVIGKDPKIDIAVLKVETNEPLTAVAFGNSEELRIGDWVVAIGNPFGLGGSVTAGIVSARARNIDSGPYDNYIQTDAAINKGNSGGPLFNMKGEVVGINTAILSPTGGSVGIGFAVPTATAMPIIEQLQEFGETRRGWLGVRIQNVDETTADALGLDRARGALVAGVDPEGPASASGIESGDVIVRFDGQNVPNSRELPRIVAGTPIGKTVDVDIIRRGEEVTLNVVIGRLAEDGAQRAALIEPPADIPDATRRALGMELSAITPELRQRFSIGENVEGVVVLEIDPNSAAADRRIQLGDVIVEVGQEPVKNPGDISSRIDAIRAEGRRSALFLISNAQGEVRFVALSLQDTDN